MRAISPVSMFSRQTFSALNSFCRITTLLTTKYTQQQQQLQQVQSEQLGGKNRSYLRYSTSTRATATRQQHPKMSSTSYCKELHLEGYDIIGFDLDGTLLRYNLNEMVPLEYAVLKEFLVEQKGYARELLDKPLVWDFLQKGLILDAQRGNVLKLAHDSTILRATHGTRMLTDLEVIATYGIARKWDISTQFAVDPLSTWNGPLAECLRAVLDYFDMPAALVFAQAVDMVDAATVDGVQPEQYTVWSDVLDGLMHMFARDNFATQESAYFKALRADIARYVLRTNQKTLDWLQNLRATGKMVFLLTGSNIDFANLTATQALGADWQELFDCVVCYAKKPGFFTIQRPFLCVEETREVQGSELPLSEILTGKVYSQGNWHQLHAALSAKLNKETENTRAIYFGDNLIQDVYAPVTHRDFDAVAISEEMLTEPECNKISNEIYADVTDSTLWGGYFSMDGTATLWSAYIGKYAQLCAPTVEHIAQCPLSKRIVCNNSNGYYPILPKELNTSEQNVIKSS